MKRLKLTILGIAALAVFPAHAHHPLEQVTYDAMMTCGVVNRISLESCGNMSGRSPEHSAARRAIIRYHQARAEFMRSCQATESLDFCVYRAEWLMIGGFTRALDDESVVQTRSLPRSDTRR